MAVSLKDILVCLGMLMRGVSVFSGGPVVAVAEYDDDAAAGGCTAAVDSFARYRGDWVRWPFSSKPKDDAVAMAGSAAQSASLEETPRC